MASVKDLETELEQARADIAALASLAAERGSDRAHGLSDAMQAMLGELSDEGRAAFEKARSEGTKLRSRAEERGAHAPARGRRARRGRRRRSGIDPAALTWTSCPGFWPPSLRRRRNESASSPASLRVGHPLRFCLLIAAVLLLIGAYQALGPGPRPALARGPSRRGLRGACNGAESGLRCEGPHCPSAQARRARPAGAGCGRVRPWPSERAGPWGERSD